MSERDANHGEMDWLRVYDIDDQEVSLMVTQIRSALQQPPDPELEERHIAAIMEEARRAPREPVPPPRAPARLLAKLGAVAAGLALLTGGLALAGVELPVLPDTTTSDSEESPAQVEGNDNEPGDSRSDTAERVQSAIQANLQLLRSGDISGCEFGAMVSAAARDVAPDSSHCSSSEAEVSDGSETSMRVQMAIETNLPLLRAGDISGCEFGALVSAAARNVDPDSSHCRSDDDPDDKVTGRDKAEEASGGKAGGKSDDEAATGQDRAEEASGGKANAGGNQESDDEGSDDEGSDDGESDDEEVTGQDKAEEASGGKAGGKSGDDEVTGKDQAEEASGGKAGGGKAQN